MAKETHLPAQFLGPNKVPIGQFEFPMSILGSSKSFKSLKVRFGSSTAALTNLTAFGLAVGATVLAVEVEV